MLVITSVPPVLMCTQNKAKPGSSPPSSGQGGVWTQCPQILEGGGCFCGFSGSPSQVCGIRQFS